VAEHWPRRRYDSDYTADSSLQMSRSIRSFTKVLFDHRNGLTTVLCLVNENTTASTVSLIFNDPTNHLIGSTTVSLNSLQSQILTLNVLVPATIGLQGTLVIQGQNTGAPASITATAIRINPTNSFTPIRAFVPSH
jgi:hypothetical protein